VSTGHIWTTSLGDSGIWDVDTASLSATRVPAQGTPIGVTTRGDTVYVVETVSGPYGGLAGGTGQVTAIGAADGGRGLHTIRTGSALAIASAPSGLWLTRQTDLVHLQPVSDIASTIDRKLPIDADAAFTGLAVGAGGIWILSDAAGRTVWRVDPGGKRIRKIIHLPFEPAAIAVGSGAVWVSALLDDEVFRIDPRTNRVVDTIKVGREPLSVGAGNGAVWVANTIDRTVTRIDPTTDRVTATIPLRTSPTALAVDRGSVWVATDAS
jgi:YVTN family beta-propeller protein